MKSNTLRQIIQALCVSGSLLMATQVSAESMISGDPINGHVLEQRGAEFVAADTNLDKMLSLEEFWALREAKLLMSIERLFEKMDADGDGSVSMDEFGNRFPGPSDVAERLFEGFSGEDGLLSQKEFTIVRLGEQGIGEGAKWDFALLDNDADRFLSFHEYLGFAPEKPDSEERDDKEASEVEFPEVDGPEIQPVPELPKLPGIHPEPELPQAQPVLERPDTQPSPVKPVPVENSVAGDSDDESNEELLARIAQLDERLAKLESAKTKLEAKLESASERMSVKISQRIVRMESVIERLQDRLSKLKAAL